MKVAPVRDPDLAILVMTGLATRANIEPKVTPISLPKSPIIFAWAFWSGAMRSD